jgi:hypothetical protein
MRSLHRILFPPPAAARDSSKASSAKDVVDAVAAVVGVAVGVPAQVPPSAAAAAITLDLVAFSWEQEDRGRWEGSPQPPAVRTKFDSSW